MKIAYFVWEYPPLMVGGLGTYASQVAPRLAKFGNDITVFTLNDGTLKTSEQMGDVKVHRPNIIRAKEMLNLIVSENLHNWGEYLSFFNKIFSYNYLSAAKFLNETLKNEKYDLVVVHDWLSAIAGLIIKQDTDLPIVFHMHSTEQQRVGGGSPTIRSFEREMAEQADSIITVSYAMKEHLIELGYPEEKINVVWNGCDTDKYKLENVNWDLVDELKKKYKIKEDEKVVFFVGRLTWIKGAESLVRGFPLVLEEYPNTRLIVLGKGEQQQSIEELVKGNGMEDKVVVRSEFVSEEERIAHYALSDLVVFPSTAEPFGIVSLEGMCLKKPVIVGASGISGFREQVINSGDEQTGVHVDGRSYEDIAWGIKEVLKDDNKAKEMGERGRKRAEVIFNLDRVASETLSVYNKAVDNKSK